MKKLLMAVSLLAASSMAVAQDVPAPPVVSTPNPNVYLVASSFDTFFYVDRASVYTEGTSKVFNMTYVQNSYRGLVVSSIKASASCSTPYKIQLWEETVYYKNAAKNALQTEFKLDPVAKYTTFPVSEVVKDDATINAGLYSFWGQTWVSVCENNWKNKHSLGDATPKLMVLDASNIGKRTIQDTVLQTTRNNIWVYRANTPPAALLKE